MLGREFEILGGGRKYFAEKTAFEQRPKRREGMSHLYSRENIPGAVQVQRP